MYLFMIFCIWHRRSLLTQWALSLASLLISLRHHRHTEVWKYFAFSLHWWSDINRFYASTAVQNEIPNENKTVALYLFGHKSKMLDQLEMYISFGVVFIRLIQVAWLMENSTLIKLTEENFGSSPTEYHNIGHMFNDMIINWVHSTHSSCWS